jgi:hypothetical protein
MAPGEMQQDLYGPWDVYGRPGPLRARDTGEAMSFSYFQWPMREELLCWVVMVVVFVLGVVIGWKTKF